MNDTIDAETLLQRALEFVKRREFLRKHVPYCPRCGSGQIQLRGWLKSPAHWRCRHCRHVFFFEPRQP